MSKGTKKAASKRKEGVPIGEPKSEVRLAVPRQRGKGEIVSLSIRLPRAD
jgi:hypothetical protein